MKHSCYIVALALASAVGLIGCRAGSQPEPQSSAAMFDSFDYVGNDAYYNSNPLPDESSYYNPILAGWYSDPSICTNGEGDYFLVTSTFTYFPGVPIFHSRDLVNWNQVGHVLTRPSQLVNIEKQHVSGGIFAPDIAYNPANKTYYMVTTNVGAGNFFVKTQDPFGEWSDPIMLPEVAGIDPAFFFDEDGKGYIVNNDDAPEGKPEYDGHRTVRVVEFDTEKDQCVGERKIVVNKGWRPQDRPIWCEGPHIYKVDGTYYLMTAEGGTGDNHSEVIYKGNSPFGPFTPWESNPILTQRTLSGDRPNAVTCAGHADMVRTPDGDWWGVFLACRPVSSGKENLGRETFMLPVKWTEDGWPMFVENGSEVPLVVSRPGAKRGENVTFGNYTRSDEFADSILGKEWMTLRGPASEYYSLEKNPGFLTIKCAEVSTCDKAPLPYVCRRLCHHEFSCSTRMTFQPEDASQAAGLLLLKDETHQYMLARVFDGMNHKIQLRKVTEAGHEVVGEKEVAEEVGTLRMKVEGKGLEYAFSYSDDDGATWQTVADKVDAGFTSTNEAGGFTGTVIGPFATGSL